jgi:hypothetical protein
MTRTKQPIVYLLNGQAATGVGAYVDVSDYKNLTLTIKTTNSTNATVKFAVSNELTAPNFSSASSATNFYDLVQITPVNSQLVADKLSGSTGIVLTGTDTLKMYTVDASNGSCNYKWICAIVTAYVAGKITVELTGSSDDTR